ncbi:MAG: hypothetical protein BWX50_01340 [Euryarchaeota archaeon ADurb.Bin009]|nr:MAG: hypothetical protein BWX50_01340 [Euryarchaeota archaeon ADurb.Bin009]
MLVWHHDGDYVAVHPVGKIFLVGDVDGYIVPDMPGKDSKPDISPIKFQVKRERGKRFEFFCALLVLFLLRLKLRACCDEAFHLFLDGGKVRPDRLPDLRCGNLLFDLNAIGIYPARILDGSDLDERRGCIACSRERVADR